MLYATTLVYEYIYNILCTSSLFRIGDGIFALKIMVRDFFSKVPLSHVIALIICMMYKLAIDLFSLKRFMFNPCAYTNIKLLFECRTFRCQPILPNNRKFV